MFSNGFGIQTTDARARRTPRTIPTTRHLAERIKKKSSVKTVEDAKIGSVAAKLNMFEVPSPSQWLNNLSRPKMFHDKQLTYRPPVLSRITSEAQLTRAANRKT